MATRGIEAEGMESKDVVSLLSSPTRNFLIRNDGTEVPVNSLKGKKVGLYFSGSWCGPCRRLTPILSEAYEELSTKGDVEIVFVAADEDDDSFKGHFSKMPWLAIPFSDLTARDSLDDSFKVSMVPYLVILDECGKVVTESGVGIIREYGAEGYPFTEERIKHLEEREEEAKRNQSLKYLLVHEARDFVITSNGDEVRYRNIHYVAKLRVQGQTHGFQIEIQVPVSELEGKTVGLYFSMSTYQTCEEFTPKLLDVYETLKSRGENFEIVEILLDDNEQKFKEALRKLPWYSLPITDRKCEKLINYFKISYLPTLVIIGPDGKTVHANIVKTVEELGAEAYPFTLERFAELADLEKAIEKAQTLESVLVKGDRDFLVRHDDEKIPVSNLVGKSILLYFSAHWCTPCRIFLPKLIEVYHEIKSKDKDFEVLFVSRDEDEVSFVESFGGFPPWLAIPFDDDRKESLSRKFKVRDTPMLVALGPTGRTLTKDAANLIMEFGADTHPFTEDHIKKMEAKLEELAEGWPKTLRHSLDDDHEFVLTKRTTYTCDECEEGGGVWLYRCEECDFDLHPKCALQKEDKSKDEDTKDVER